MAVTPSFQLQIAHRLKHWIFDFLGFETTYSMHKLNFRKCSKSGWHDCHQEYASWQISLCFSSLHSGFAYGKGLQSFGSSCFWALHCFAMDSKELCSILDCFGDQKAIKTPKLNTIGLELLAKVLNMLIGLKGNNYYSKVFKRVNYKLSNSTFWVVIKKFFSDLLKISPILSIKTRYLLPWDFLDKPW